MLFPGSGGRRLFIDDPAETVGFQGYDIPFHTFQPMILFILFPAFLQLMHMGSAALSHIGLRRNYKNQFIPVNIRQVMIPVVASISVIGHDGMDISDQILSGFAILRPGQVTAVAFLKQRHAYIIVIVFPPNMVAFSVTVLVHTLLDMNSRPLSFFMPAGGVMLPLSLPKKISYMDTFAEDPLGL